MPTYRFRSFVSHIVLPVAAFVFSLEAAVAADPTTPASVPAPVRFQTLAITVDFAGGSVADFVAAASKSGGASFNLIGEKNDLATMLPPFSLREADPSSVAGALNLLLSPKGLSITQTGAVFVLTRGNPQGARDSVFESFQLTPFLDFQSVDDIVGAVRAAWELNPSNKAESLQIKYHPATNLLLVSGSREALNTAGRVVGALKRSPAASTEAPRELPTPAPATPPTSGQARTPAPTPAQMKQWTDEIERRRNVRTTSPQPPAKSTPVPDQK